MKPDKWILVFLNRTPWNEVKMKQEHRVLISPHFKDISYSRKKLDWSRTSLNKSVMRLTLHVLLLIASNKNGECTHLFSVFLDFFCLCLNNFKWRRLKLSNQCFRLTKVRLKNLWSQKQKRAKQLIEGNCDLSG